MNFRGLKNAICHQQEFQRMNRRIADRVVVTIQVISQAAVVIVVGMILMTIGASIYGMFGATR
jgi:hypothetical protein